MAEVTIPLGANAKAYRGTVEMKNIRDVTLNLTKGEADVTTRGSFGWKQSLPTLKEASIEFEMVCDTTDPDYKALSAAFFTGKPVELMFLDTPFVAGLSGTGLHAWCGIFDFSRQEPLDGSLLYKVTCKPTYAGSDPEKVPKWLEDGVDVMLDNGGTP